MYVFQCHTSCRGFSFYYYFSLLLKLRFTLRHPDSIISFCDFIHDNQVLITTKMSTKGLDLYLNPT